MTLPAHSPLGASSAERWMNCVGSTALIKKLTLPDTDEPDYRAEGTAAHEKLAKCLEQGLDAWEIAGETASNGVAVTPAMVDAIQAFIDIARPLMAGARKVYIEHQLSAPGFHPLFYGTVDFAVQHGIAGSLLDVLDFKYGEGVIVEAHENPQIMYYAYGILRDHPEIDRVRMQIVQPRITWNKDEPYEITANALREWAEGTLRPAMERADRDNGPLEAGEWCRFCPAKLVCPLLTHLFGAAATANPKEVVEFDDAAVDRNYPLIAPVEHYLKALKGEAFNRVAAGKQFEKIKLVQKKANRVFHPGAEAVFKSKFGDDAYTKPELKSPAVMEELGEVAKSLVREYAFTPESGLTVALKTDKRPEVKVQSVAQAFAGVAPKVGDDE